MERYAARPMTLMYTTDRYILHSQLKVTPITLALAFASTTLVVEQPILISHTQRHHGSLRERHDGHNIRGCDPKTPVGDHINSPIPIAFDSLPFTLPQTHRQNTCHKSPPTIPRLSLYPSLCPALDGASPIVSEPDPARRLKNEDYVGDPFRTCSSPR